MVKKVDGSLGSVQQSVGVETGQRVVTKSQPPGVRRASDVSSSSNISQTSLAERAVTKAKTSGFNSLEERSTALFEALERSDLKAFKAILKAGNTQQLIKIHNAEGKTIAHLAAEKGVCIKITMREESAIYQIVKGKQSGIFCVRRIYWIKWGQ